MQRRADDDLALASLAGRSTTVSVCVPALDEAPTIEAVLEPFLAALRSGLVDQVAVADSGSSDGTAELAAAAGADVIEVARAAPGPLQGKGDTVRRALPSLHGDVLVLVDGDIEEVGRHYLTRLAAPLLESPRVQLVKGAFRRPLNVPHGGATGGGRVTEILAKPVLALLYPDLAGLDQPLSGQIAVRRSWLRGLALWPGYGLEIGMLLDTYKRAGAEAIVEADLGALLNAHQDLAVLGGMSREVLAVVLHHLADEGRFSGELPDVRPLAPIEPVPAGG